MQIILHFLLLHIDFPPFSALLGLPRNTWPWSPCLLASGWVVPWVYGLTGNEGQERKVRAITSSSTSTSPPLTYLDNVLSRLPFSNSCLAIFHSSSSHPGSLNIISFPCFPPLLNPAFFCILCWFH